MNRSGRLLVFEGPDGVGKSSLAANVADVLRKFSLPITQLSLPGQEPGTLGKHVYDLHHQPNTFGVKEIDPTSLQVLHAAAHIDALNRRIKPALRQGHWVVLDRFWWSTIIYGRVLGACERTLTLLETIARHHWSDVNPTALFLIRRRHKSSDDLLPFLAAEYEGLAQRPDSPFPIHMIENNSTLLDATEQILELLGSYLPKNVTLSSRKMTCKCKADRKEEKPGTPVIWHQHDPVKPTPVFDSYWRFAAERQEILYRRLAGQPSPWTNDPILRFYRFTNAYRAADRVSQYLIRHVIYDAKWDSEDLIFRILLFKIFNKIETWELLNKSCGPITYHGFHERKYTKVLESTRARGTAIYSAAYIMASGESAFGYKRKHENHLALLRSMMKDHLASRLMDSSSLTMVYEMLRQYPMLGPFLAFQYAIDLNYSELIDFDEMSCVVPGPGARDGIAKCFHDRGGLSETDIIKWVAERQALEFQRLGIRFRDLGGRSLQLIDCQNLFCEIDKYARVFHPEFSGRSGRTRIKQTFTAPRREPISLWFPPKWKINDAFPIQNKMETPLDEDLFGPISK